MPAVLGSQSLDSQTRAFAVTLQGLAVKQHYCGIMRLTYRPARG